MLVAMSSEVSYNFQKKHYDVAKIIHSFIMAKVDLC